MKLTKLGTIGAIALVGALALAGCATNEPTTPEEPGTSAEPTLSGELKGQGASSQEKAQVAWAATLQNANGGLTINYTADGSGNGRKAFATGAVDYAGSDRALKTSEIADPTTIADGGTFASCLAGSDIIELPLYISPIAVGYNLPGVDGLQLDADTLAKIFSGKITTWNDPAIAAQNTGATLPAETIKVIYRSENSGTTENFVAYLKATAPDAWSYDVSGDWPTDLAAITGFEGAAGTGDVAGLLANEYYIGYLDASRAPGQTVAVKVGDSYVAYSPEGAAAVVDASPLESGRTAGDLAISLDRTTTAAGAYPVVLISYLIACDDYADPAKAELVKAYFSYIASEEGQTLAHDEAGSAPISSTLRTQIEAAIALID